ncbi:Type 1 glutamine amidotransferase-like domain-containing protein [Microbacterium oleivorans]|uniref:Type 1 glutamine amidotransferase-like domain-containing protein n=1 Tax=Microbacterium oleivorans TaxID=273677 RepID=A0A7D5JXL0_9MICO|nr:Type 1 glutamine amidotransferase-like domain-containing protein [Microbacterium oleivorans]QLD11103.1 Type 1 glutamine amidotransferase-like domain-containing protein [Microbacterium oleivorans]
MRLLLLSLHAGAVRAFLDDPDDGDAAASGPIVYVADAQAAFPDAPFVAAERETVRSFGREVVEVTLRDTSPQDAAALLADAGAVYVAGGSTFALLEALRLSGNDAVLVDRVREGLPYIGLSAGSIVAGPDVTPASLMDDPADGPALVSRAGLGLVDVTVIPHADGALPPYPTELIDRTIDAYGSDFALLPLRDDQAFLVDGETATVVGST